MVEASEFERFEMALRKTTVVSRDENRERVKKMSRKLVESFSNRGPVPLFVKIVEGADRYAADLIGLFPNAFPIDVHSVKASSYQDIIQGNLYFDHLGLDPARIKGRDVLIIEDIVDTGVTMKTVTDYILAHDPRSLQVTALIDKKSNRTVKPEIGIKFVVHPELDGDFYVGYGMDYQQMFRTMNHISVLTEELRNEVMAKILAIK